MPDYPMCSDCDHVEEYLNSLRDAETDLFTVELVLDSIKIDARYEPFVNIALNIVRSLQKIMKVE